MPDGNEQAGTSSDPRGGGAQTNKGRRRNPGADAYQDAATATQAERHLTTLDASESSKAEAALTDEIKKLHADFVAEVHKRELSSSENFDKSVLTFSSAGLALSVGFLKDFVPIRLAAVPWALYTSWILFTLATCATMLSFLVSSRALAEQKNLAYVYYVERDESAFQRDNRWDRLTRLLNYISGGSFLLAMVLTVVFISINLEKGSDMKTNDGIGVPKIQAAPVLLQKGLPVPSMQKVPSGHAQTPVTSVPAAVSAPAVSSTKPTPTK